MKYILLLLLLITFSTYSQKAKTPAQNPACAGGAQTSGCGGLTTMTDARDGQVYKIVQIGTQCWMAQNLNYGTYAAVTAPQEAGTKFCQNLIGENDASCPFGGLYEWVNMMNGGLACNGDAACPPCSVKVKGLCPSGWHVPSYYEWTLLEKNSGTNPAAFPYDVSTTDWLGTDEGGNLKQTGTENWKAPNAGATNNTGFNALPRGFSYGGGFRQVGSYGFWWSVTENGGDAWVRLLGSTDANVNRNLASKSRGYSVRCVKD